MITSSTSRASTRATRTNIRAYLSPLGPAAILTAFLGCATLGVRGDVIVLQRQEQAVHIIWHDIYGHEDLPPAVRWVVGAELTCEDPHSHRPGFETAVGCREGFTMSGLEVSVAYHDGDTFSQTVLGHELEHASQARRGIIDSDHDRPEWQPLETCPSDGQIPACGIVERANNALAAAGL